MISKIAQKIVDALCVASVVDEEDKELYTYGFFVLVSRIFFFLVTIIWGIAFGILWESILFYFIFTVIRSYAGGVHASKESSCTLYTSLAMLISTMIIKMFLYMEMTVVSAMILLIGYVLIVIFSPLDTNEKPLDDNERRKYKKITCLLVTVVLAGVAVFCIMGRNDIVHICAVAVGLESTLLLIGVIKKKGSYTYWP